MGENVKKRGSRLLAWIVLGACTLVAMWASWGFLVFLLARRSEVRDAATASGLVVLANYAEAFGVLASLVTSVTVITAAIQFVQGNEETRKTIELLERSTKAQSLLSRSEQISLMFDSYMTNYLKELEQGVTLWGVKCNSMHAIRNVVSDKYHSRAQSEDFARYYGSLAGGATAGSGEAADFRRAALAMGHELQQMGVKCLTGAIPAGVLLPNMSAHFALQWLLCAPLIHETWTLSEAAHIAEGGGPIVHFSRRHGFWLAIISALYARKYWPNGKHAAWAEDFIAMEFAGSAERAREMMRAIYACDSNFFERNAEIESLMALV